MTASVHRWLATAPMTPGVADLLADMVLRTAWSRLRERTRTRGHHARMTADADKRAAARYAARLAEPGMRVGLGTGTTVAHLLPALAERAIDLRCVATSPATERAARALGLHVEPFDALDELDLAIDGADQVAPDGWLTKGGGRAHVREKLVAASARPLRRHRLGREGRRAAHGAGRARAARLRAHRRRSAGWGRPGRAAASRARTAA